MTGRFGIDIGDERWVADPEPLADLSIPLDFHGAQPRHFDAQPAAAVPMRAGTFVGDTRRGGSCNAEIVTVNIHCNGTHTEGVGHITRERIPVIRNAPAAPILLRLLSVAPVSAADCAESLPAAAHAGDRVITAASLADNLTDAGGIPALAVRTLPNDARKLARRYGSSAMVPYFTLTAVDALVAAGIEHLLVDMPSIDRLHDDGALENHRRFWGLADDGIPARPAATVTELIYVADTVDDGTYLLNLQLAPFLSDATPSRPLIHALRRA